MDSSELIDWREGRYASLVLDFMAEIESIPWFEALGKPSSRDASVFRIYSWETWPGPENAGAELQGSYWTKWHDELFGDGQADSSKALKLIWDSIYTKVFDIAASRIPYSSAKDVWYGPNAAAQMAAYCAALVGCTLFTHGTLGEIGPEWSQWTLANEWSWFSDGHWPCMYFWSWSYASVVVAERTGGPKRLVIF